MAASGFGKSLLILFGFALAVIGGYYFFKHERTTAPGPEIQSEKTSWKVPPAKLQAHVKMLSEKIGERSHRRLEALSQALDYLVLQIKTDYPNHSYQQYSDKDANYKNLVIEKPGKNPILPILLIGAHYDSRSLAAGVHDKDGPGCPGADGNASGTAVLIELAILMAHRETERTIRFVFFTLEEAPQFNTKMMGSRRYVSSILDKTPSVGLMICFESVGYYSAEKIQKYPREEMKSSHPASGDFVLVVGREEDAGVTRNFYDALKLRNPFGVELFLARPEEIAKVDFSDHREFWRKEIPALMVTDSASYRNPNYHGLGDLPNTLDYEKMSMLTESLEAALVDLDKTMEKTATGN